jgi:predicted protein tyrosine phosphatase
MELITLSVPDEAYYFECTWWSLFKKHAKGQTNITANEKGQTNITANEKGQTNITANEKGQKDITLSVPDEAYYFECTWWSLFKKHAMHTKSDSYVFVTL